MVDVCIIGAGPAGLSAATILGRCRRNVVVFDSGQPRNAASRGLHGFLTRDGIPPLELRTIGRTEIARYPSVRIVDVAVASVRRHAGGFEVVTADSHAIQARILLLATGRVDVLPEIPGFRSFYGRGVYHCPYCDGWEHRDRDLIAYGDCPGVVSLALELRTWSPHVTLCPVTGHAPAPEHRAKLAQAGIAIAPRAIAELTGPKNGDLTGVRLEDASILPCDALFFISPVPQKSALPASLGCRLDDEGSVVCEDHAATGVPGLYVAGNVRGGIHLAIMAAAEGAEAAVAINEALAAGEHGGEIDRGKAQTGMNG